MTNYEKFKSAEERAEAFYKYCETEHHTVSACSVLHWLDLEAEEEKPLPCPFCGGLCKVNHGTRYGDLYQVICLNATCGYDSQLCGSNDAALAAHNRVARAVKKANR